MSLAEIDDSRTMRVCLLKRGEERPWDDYVRGCPTATHSHLSGWRSVIEKAYGHKTHYLWAREGATTHGILPLVLIRSLLFILRPFPWVLNTQARDND